MISGNNYVCVYKLLFYILIMAVTVESFGQISPPGLDDTNVAFWSAIAINKKISKRWSVSAYGGMSGKSDPDNFSLFKKRAAFVINQEIAFEIDKRWGISFGASYRGQNQYKKESPFHSDEPDLKNENRYYFRFNFRRKFDAIGFTVSLRPELRLYYFDGHTWNPIDEELRIRLKTQASIPLDQSRTNEIIVANEIMTTTDHEKNETSDHWTHYSYTEDRVSTFLRHRFNHVLVGDIGMMHQIKANGNYIAHLSFDVIFRDPFGGR